MSSFRLLGQVCFEEFQRSLSVHKLSLILEQSFTKCVCTCLSFWSKHWCSIGRAQPTMAMA
jgi:hypothetical protein